MATTKKQTKKRAPSHALFWTLLKEVPGYDPGYKDVIKEGLVHQYSGGRTQSLSEMYSKYPCEYSLMIEAMKGTPQQKKTRYEDSLDKMKKRVIAAICQYVDKLGYTFPTKADKVRYVIGIAATSMPFPNRACRPSTISIASATAWTSKAMRNWTILYYPIDNYGTHQTGPAQDSHLEREGHTGSLVREGGHATGVAVGAQF